VLKKSKRAATVFKADRSEFNALIKELKEDSKRRDLVTSDVRDYVGKLKEIGLGAARIPAALGGAGIPLAELFALLFEIAKAEPNVAHVLRNHFLFVEGLIKPDLQEGNRALIERAVAGELFGLSHHENSDVPAGTAIFNVVLTPLGDEFRLNGDKAYSTGNLYSDTIVVAATGPDGANAIALVPADREGVEHLDDWDGIGQTLTGSGTTRYRDVVVYADELLSGPRGSRVRPYGSTFAQLWLTTIVAAILNRAVEDAAEVVRSRKRNYFHGLSPEPRNDPNLQQTLGALSAHAHVAETAVRDAAVRLDRSWNSGGGVTIDIDVARDASVAALQTKIVVDGVAQWLTSELFEVVGASGTTRAKRLDRHWRNARTLSSHNPKAYKARVLGDYLLNNNPPPDATFF